MILLGFLQVIKEGKIECEKYYVEYLDINGRPVDMLTTLFGAVVDVLS